MTGIYLGNRLSKLCYPQRITGVRLGSLLFCGFILLGEVMFCLGIQFKLYYLALVGRFVFGLGGESLTVAQNTYTARWFDGKSLFSHKKKHAYPLPAHTGKQLALAFGLVLSFSRIGSSVNFAVTPFLTRMSLPYFLPLKKTLTRATKRYRRSGCHLVWRSYLRVFFRRLRVSCQLGYVRISQPSAPFVLI